MITNLDLLTEIENNLLWLVYLIVLYSVMRLIFLRLKPFLESFAHIVQVVDSVVYIPHECRSLP